MAANSILVPTQLIPIILLMAFACVGAHASPAEDGKLCDATQAGNAALVTALLGKGASANTICDPSNSNYSKPIIIAVNLDRPDLVSELLDHGANPNARLYDINGNGGVGPALLHAHSVAMADLLLQHGADPNLIGPDGDTPLIDATLANEKAIVIDLLDHGADPSLVGMRGLSSLYYAKDHNYADLVALLVARGAVEATFHPQSRSGAGKGFAPIGILTPDSPAPFLLPNGTTIMTKEFRATAFLVSPCYIITNFHAVYGETKEFPDFSIDHSASFYVGEDLNTGFKRKIHATPVAHGNWKRPSDVVVYEGVGAGYMSSLEVSSQEDWALLRLDKCAGADREIGWIDLARTSWSHFRGEKMYLAGYPVDHTGKILWISDPCQIYEDLKGVSSTIHHGCVSGPGDSGAPIVVFDSSGNLLAIAMHSIGDNSRTGHGLNLSLLMRDPRFGPIVEKDLADWNIPNPSHVSDQTPPTSEAPH